MTLSGAPELSSLREGSMGEGEGEGEMSEGGVVAGGWVSLTEGISGRSQHGSGSNPVQASGAW